MGMSFTNLHVRKTADLNIDSNVFNEKVKKDKSLNTKLIIILIVMSAVTVGLYFKSEKDKSANEYAEQVASDNRLETIKTAYNRITPQLIFYKTKNESGHLRQDLRKELTNLGFVRDDDKEGVLIPYSSAEVYSLNIYGEDSPVMQIVLNKETRLSFKKYDDITDAHIILLLPNLADEYKSAFKENLEQNGFVVASNNNIKTTPFGTRLPFLINSETYIRIGKTVRKQDDLFFNYDVVEFKKGYHEDEIVCYSYADEHIK